MLTCCAPACVQLLVPVLGPAVDSLTLQLLAPVIGGLGGVDVPAGRWPELLPLLLAASPETADKPTLATAFTLLTALFACMKEGSVGAADVSACVDFALSGCAADAAMAIRTAALAMLGALAPLVPKRHAAVDKMYEAACAAAVLSDEGARVAGMDCVIELEGPHYHSLAPHISKMFAVSGSVCCVCCGGCSMLASCTFWPGDTQWHEERV